MKGIKAIDDFKNNFRSNKSVKIKLNLKKILYLIELNH